jgi:hypothetical protein
MAGPATTPVRVTAPKEVPHDVAEQVRGRMAALADVADPPPLDARLTLCP